MNKIEMPTLVGKPKRRFLTQDEEQWLIDRCQQGIDPPDHLIQAFSPFLCKMAADFKRAKGIDTDLFELVHVGVYGLETDRDNDRSEIRPRGFVYAISKFDLGQPYRLATSARVSRTDSPVGVLMV